MSEEEVEAKAIKCGILIDGTGAEPRRNVTVLIEGSKIKAVGTDVSIPEGAKVIDAVGKTVMPGLIDSHMHNMGMKTDNFITEMIIRPEQLALIKSVNDFKLLLEAGFTTVKDCGGKNGLFLKKAKAEGTIRGPRILAAGYALSQTFGHGDTHYFPWEYAKKLNPTMCDGVPECIRAARLALREGADFIKVCTTGGVMSERDLPTHTQFTIEEIKAIVMEAHKADTFVTAHCQGTEGMHNSIDGGIKTIDHAFYPDDYCIEMAIKKDVLFVPTLSIMRRIIDGGVKAGYPPWGVKKAADAWDDTVKNIAKAHKAGVTMAAATDFCGSPLMKQGTNVMELELLVKYCEFTPMEAIVAATMNGAKACGIEDKTGTVEAGKFADIIVVDGNPVSDIKILQDLDRIKLVMLEGTIEHQRP